MPYGFLGHKEIDAQKPANQQNSNTGNLGIANGNLHVHFSTRPMGASLLELSYSIASCNASRDAIKKMFDQIGNAFSSFQSGLSLICL